jgi:hypothetical protein
MVAADNSTKSLFARFEKKYGVKASDTKFISQYILKKRGIDGILGGRRDARGYAILASVILGGKARKVYRSAWETHKVKGPLSYDQIVASFKPNLTPRRMFVLGSFGGTYWRDIQSGVVGKRLSGVHKRYPKSWWASIPNEHLTKDFDKYDKSMNRYGVKVGTTLKFWESKKWITKSHPYGWVQWYCDWCVGKRCPDDVRQIRRWAGVAGPRGRFRTRLINMIHQRKTHVDDATVSPAIRQTLQHWAYKLNRGDYNRKISGG